MGFPNSSTTIPFNCIEESTFCAELNKPGEIKLAQTANMDILYFM